MATPAWVQRPNLIESLPGYMPSPAVEGTERDRRHSRPLEPGLIMMKIAVIGATGPTAFISALRPH